MELAAAPSPMPNAPPPTPAAVADATTPAPYASASGAVPLSAIPRDSRQLPAPTHAPGAKGDGAPEQLPEAANKELPAATDRVATQQHGQPASAAAAAAAVETQPTVEKAVERAVEKAVERAVGRAVGRAVEATAASSTVGRPAPLKKTNSKVLFDKAFTKISAVNTIRDDPGKSAGNRHTLARSDPQRKKLTKSQYKVSELANLIREELKAAILSTVYGNKTPKDAKSPKSPEFTHGRKGTSVLRQLYSVTCTAANPRHKRMKTD